MGEIIIEYLLQLLSTYNYWVPSNYADIAVNKIDSLCSQVVYILLRQVNNK